MIDSALKHIWSHRILTIANHLAQFQLFTLKRAQLLSQIFKTLLEVSPLFQEVIDLVADDLVFDL